MKKIILKIFLVFVEFFWLINCLEVNNNNNTVGDTIKKELNFAVLLPLKSTSRSSTPSLHEVLPAIELAVRKIQEPEFGLLQEFRINVMYNDTRCSSTYGPLAAFEMYTNFKPDAFFGPVCDYVLAPVARYTGIWQIPILTAGGLAEAFSFKNLQYPTLTRIMGNYGYLGIAMQGIIEQFNWSVVGILFHNYGVSRGKGHSDCSLTVAAIFRAINQTTYTNSFDEDEIEPRALHEMLELTMKKARIIIMCGNPNVIREIMLAADELNMVGSGEYVFFNIELFASMSPTSMRPWHNKNDTDERNLRAKHAYTALLTVTAKQPDDDAYKIFSDEVKAIAKLKYNYTFNADEPVSTFVTAFYDAVLLYAYALNATLKTGKDILMKPLNGTKMAHLMWGRNFTGITGDVEIDSNGDRISDYSLLDMDPETGNFEIVANYYHKTGLQYVEGKKIHWSGGRLEPPADRPVCGFDNSLCPDSFPGYAILSLVLGFAFILMAIISLLGYRHYKLEAEINSMSWKINWNDVLPCNPTSKHRGSIYSLGKRGSQITVYSEDMGTLDGDRQLFIPIGFYKGCKIAIKKINTTNISLNRALMLELKKMKDLQHDHLVRFCGACVDPPNSCILTEYCPKGSLQDILENEQIKLDWMFKLSLMHDIVRGMQFLHSTDIHSHGALKSSNCVVDSRFVLKITDFGLHELRRLTDEEENCDSFAYWKRLLWTAPELLRMSNPPPNGTQKGDVYSFAIIVHEIITRQGPFYLGHEDRSPRDIIEIVKNGPKLLLGPFRPKIDDNIYEEVTNIMSKCWSEDPTDRPDFGFLKSTIRKINKENESGNILDNLLQRMEQYANNLESLVQERTQDYLEEKKKCEELLYQLLPKSVAAQLILGKPVIAETYDQVTIYFSDIVGFTAISAQSTPMQVVNLLNDLYTCFDSIVVNYDVYKVETIGDAYMVVSGLPGRNGDKHAREIARLALALLAAVFKFTIKHRPNEQLRLRIGLHSGPCVAGVVGLKMPRYCLFGDTVNTASRMESNGEALKIHVSNTTKEILDKFGSFDLTKRGLVEMKGKGAMLTYWLNGETPLNNVTTSPTSCLANKNQDTTIAATIEDLTKSGGIQSQPQSQTQSPSSVPPPPPPQQPSPQSTVTIQAGNGNLHTNPDKKLNNLTYNNFTKSNNIINQYTKKKFSIGDDNIKSVTQPLLARN